MLRRIALTVLLVATMVAAAQPAGAAPVAPAHIAALGDSITRAFDVNGSYFLKDAPEESWSTGGDSRVQSQYLRLQQLRTQQGLDPASLVRENDAVTGAKMIALHDQMSAALANGSDYVTVLMGANDVCTKTVSGMTPVETFRAQFASAMAQVEGKDVRVFVSSIPNVNRLYELFSRSSSAKLAWSLYGVCQSLLSSRATVADRKAVADRVVADNLVLQQVCQSYSNCTWDRGATYGVSFTTTDVSTVDYFHPSIPGQAKLASTAWAVSPYGP